MYRLILSAPCCWDGSLRLRRQVEIIVHDKKSGEPVPCEFTSRILRVNRSEPPASVLFDHFVCPGKANLELMRECTPSRSSAARKLQVRELSGDQGKDRQILFPARTPDRSYRRGWWSGDLHVHRPVAAIDLLMRAEDLHIAPSSHGEQAKPLG